VEKLAFIVTTPPYSNLTITAIALIKTAIEENMPIVGVFFYQDGVLNGQKLVEISSDEYQCQHQWQQLNQQHKLPLYLCSTAAEKRGVSDTADNNTVHSAFIMAGLGELVELCQNTKVVQL